MESITNQSFPETRQLEPKKIGRRIVRNERGEDTSLAVERLLRQTFRFSSTLSSKKRCQSCQDTRRATGGNETGWNLVIQRFANFSPVTHKFAFILYNFFPRCTYETKEAKIEKRKKEGETVDSADFFFFLVVKKLHFFAPSFNFYRSQFVQGPCVLVCVRKRILRSYPRDAESSLNPLSVFHVVKPESFGIPLFACPYVQSLWYRPVIARISSLYSTFRYSCFPRWFICV